MKGIQNFEKKLLAILLLVCIVLFLGWQMSINPRPKFPEPILDSLQNKERISGLDPIAQQESPPLSPAVNDYRLKVIETVVKNLLSSSGYGADLPIPQIQISFNRENGASYLPKGIGDLPTIVVEEAAYATAQSFGADSLKCLACFLGHELSHYLNEDSLHTSFMEHHGDLNSNTKDQNLQYASLKREQRADQQGAFWSLLAGYELDPDEAYIERLYKNYKIEELGKGYPTLKVRKEAIREAKYIARSHYHTLVAANYALAFKDFDMAAELYSKVGLLYQGFDFLNNYALALANKALHLGDRKIQHFALPFEYQWEGRMHKLGLQEGERSILIEIEQAQRNLLQQAHHYLSMAVALNPKPNIRLNQLIIKLLLDFKKDKDTLYRELITAQKKFSGRNREIATFGLGLYHALNKDTVQAKKYWTVSNYHAADLSAKALFNYQLLNNQLDTTVFKGTVQNHSVLELLPSEKLSYSYLQNPSRVVYRYQTRHQIVVFERIFSPANSAPKNGETMIIGQEKLILDSAKREIWKLDRRGKVVEKVIVSIM